MGHKDPTHPPGDQSMVGAEGVEHAASSAGALTEVPPSALANSNPHQDSPSTTPADRDGTVASPESQDEGNVSIGKVPTISKEDGTEVDHPALSPPVPLPLSPEVAAAAPQITTLTEVHNIVLTKGHATHMSVTKKTKTDSSMRAFIMLY